VEFRSFGAVMSTKCNNDRPNVKPVEKGLSANKSPFDYAAWLVDLDGTLYRQPLVRAAMAAELALFGWREIRTLRAFRQEQERLRHSDATVDLDPYLQQINRTALRLGVTDERVAAIVQRWMIDRPGRWLRLFRRRRLLEAIAVFREAGGKTAIVSDYPARLKLGAMAVAGLFDVVIACGDADAPTALKPHPAGLLRAVEKLGVSPEQCLVIGDRDDADREAARRAGMAFRHAVARWAN
jgi:HAD superfamily hydrolase (TIGR01549 family)